MNQNNPKQYHKYLVQLATERKSTIQFIDYIQRFDAEHWNCYDWWHKRFGGFFSYITISHSTYYPLPYYITIQTKFKSKIQCPIKYSTWPLYNIHTYAGVHSKLHMHIMKIGLHSFGIKWTEENWIWKNVEWMETLDSLH